MSTGVLSNFLPLGRIAMHISTLARNSDVVAATLALHPPQSGTEEIELLTMSFRDRCRREIFDHTTPLQAERD